ncbi:hypothetical protein FPOAC2_08731 [Fusarium poae]|jgi:hypothetical protein|uniref:Uncharacterized protein n=1 Tax=Fusarium poae TaxID=36050 RepID=A0A1B8AM35_FUSPO|nr:hypothetical protein FPOAC1_008798 [Fusarium poae]KAG8669403.1 hypothetical protein FPOAC1_008798 [Fusarium poae]OBS21629.1 hypothetical protein FPOA_07965 [Fusarium poae]
MSLEIPPELANLPLPPLSPHSLALPPLPAPLIQTNPQPNFITIVEHAVVMHSERKWKVVNMDPRGPQKNIAWKIPRSNNWLARVSNPRANTELLNMIRPAQGNTMRGYVSTWDDDVSLSIIICKIRANEQGEIEYVPGGVKPSKEEDFIPWLASVMGFDAIYMPSGCCGCHSLELS